MNDDFEVWMQIRDDVKCRRKQRVENLMRPGLGRSKRKAPAIDLTTYLPSPVEATCKIMFWSGWREGWWLLGPSEMTPEVENSRVPRREGLKLREGLDRCIPQCKVTILASRNSEVSSMEYRDSTLTHWTKIEGVPETWMDVIRRQTMEFRFTPIEGVLERLLTRTSMIRTPCRKDSVYTEIEAIPEKQWIFPLEQQQQKRNSGSLMQESQNEAMGSTGGSLKFDVMHDGHTGEFYNDVREQEISQVESAQIEQHHVRRRSTFKKPDTPATTKAFAEDLDCEIVLPEIEVQDLQSPLSSVQHVAPSMNSIPEQEPQEVDDGISVDTTLEIVSNSARSQTHGTEDGARSSLLGSDVGMRWVNGCRRSQRNRCKPLRWWEGEQKVYGRQHNTLATVTGYVTKSPKPEWPRPSPKTARKKHS